MTDRELMDIAEQAAKNAVRRHIRASPWARRWSALTARCSPAATWRTRRWAAPSAPSAPRPARPSARGTRTLCASPSGARGENYCMPCGACRQFLTEFSTDMEVLCAKAGGRYVSYKLRELLPHTFNY